MWVPIAEKDMLKLANLCRNLKDIHKYTKNIVSDLHAKVNVNYKD